MDALPADYDHKADALAAVRFAWAKMAELEEAAAAAIEAVDWPAYLQARLALAEVESFEREALGWVIEDNA